MSERLEKLREDLEDWLRDNGVNLTLLTSGGTGDIELEDTETLESIHIR